MAAKVPLEVRLWSRVDRRGANECWPWIGGTSDGRGHFWLNGENVNAYRVVYSLVRGVDISTIETLDHLCRNPLCVNPDHLEPCSRGENARRYMQTITHCPQGHEYNAENTRVYGRKRQCIACQRARVRKPWSLRQAQWLANQAKKREKNLPRASGGGAT